MKRKRLWSINRQARVCEVSFESLQDDDIDGQTDEYAGVPEQRRWGERWEVGIYGSFIYVNISNEKIRCCKDETCLVSKGSQSKGLNISQSLARQLSKTTALQTVTAQRFGT